MDLKRETSFVKATTDVKRESSFLGSLISGAPQTPSTTSDAVIIEGYLSKQNRKGVWDKRWFVIAPKELKLRYTHIKPSTWRMEDKPVEAVNLQYIEAVHPTSGSRNACDFSLIYKESPNAEKAEAYNLRAPDVQTMSRWIKVVTNIIMLVEDQKKAKDKLLASSRDKLNKSAPKLGESKESNLNPSKTILSSSSSGENVNYGIPNISINDNEGDLNSVLVDLATYLCNSDLANTIQTKAFEPMEIETNGEISLQIIKYCIKELGLGLRSRYVCAIRTIHSTLLSPDHFILSLPSLIFSFHYNIKAINEIQEYANPHKFAPIENSWSIKFQKKKKGNMLVNHTMKMESAGGENLYFNFEWSLILEFNYAFNVCIRRTVNVLNLSFSPDGSNMRNKNLNPKQTALRDSLKPLFSTALEYSNIHSRSITELATAKDIPRLVWGIHILSSEGHNLYQAPPMKNEKDDFNDLVAVCKCLYALAEMVNDDVALDFLSEKLDNYLPTDTPHGLIDKQLLALFRDKDLPINSRFILLLKAINQDIIAPAVISLKFPLKELRYNDVPNTWRVCVRYEIDGIHINHCKWEQQQGGDVESDEYFKFEWMLDLRLNENTLRCTDAKVWIMNYQFGPNTSLLHKQKVESLLKAHMPEGRPFTLNLRKLLEIDSKRKTFFVGESVPVDDCDVCASSMEERILLG